MERMVVPWPSYFRNSPFQCFPDFTGIGDEFPIRFINFNALDRIKQL